MGKKSLMLYTEDELVDYVGSLEEQILNMSDNMRHIGVHVMFEVADNINTSESDKENLYTGLRSIQNMSEKAIELLGLESSDESLNAACKDLRVELGEVTAYGLAEILDVEELKLKT